MNQAAEKNSKVKYTQFNVSVRSKLVETFKAACEINGTHMDFVISGYMEAYSNAIRPKKTYSPHLAKRSQRRTAVRDILGSLEIIRDNEQNYIDRIPENLLGSEACELAEQSVEIIDEAIDILEMAY